MRPSSSQFDASNHRRKVTAVFRDSAANYERVNDLMSLGAHRLWRRLALFQLGIQPHQDVLDLAAGTCDFGLLAAASVQKLGSWTAADASVEMLDKGRLRMEDAGILAIYSLCQAEDLPFDNGSFDRIALGFGLRNFSDREAALAEMLRVLRPGGRCVILEATRIDNAFLEGLRSKVARPWMTLAGRLGAGLTDAYEYLAASIDKLPLPAELEAEMAEAGFVQLRRIPLSLGVASLFVGYKD